MSYSDRNNMSINQYNAMMDRIILGGRNRLRKEKEDYAAMLVLVIEEVHPSQFRALPPSPAEIQNKAAIIGIWVGNPD